MNEMSRAGPSARSKRATTPTRRSSRSRRRAAGAHLAIRRPCQPGGKPGRLRGLRAGGESLFCIRGRDGVIRTFYNVCQHRAHQLVRAKATRVVVCPYHAWTYELTGELRAAPNIEIRAGLRQVEDLPDRGAHRGLPGFVFVNLDPDAAPMDDWFPKRERTGGFVPHWAELKPLEWVEIPENCNWKVSVENYSECYHCTLNHPTFATGVIKPETYDIQPQGYCLRHTTECRTSIR
jgi:phenylpropionate dioxygenase-like ring-hydroxylating dioxygenase large terminal subunit